MGKSPSAPKHGRSMVTFSLLRSGQVTFGSRARGRYIGSPCRVPPHSSAGRNTRKSQTDTLCLRQGAPSSQNAFRRQSSSSVHRITQSDPSPHVPADRVFISALPAASAFLFPSHLSITHSSTLQNDYPSSFFLLQSTSSPPLFHRGVHVHLNASPMTLLFLGFLLQRQRQRQQPWHLQHQSPRNISAT